MVSFTLCLFYYVALFFPSFVGSPLSLLFPFVFLFLKNGILYFLITVSIILSFSSVLDKATFSTSICIGDVSVIGAVALEDGAVKSRGMYGFPATLKYAYDGWSAYSSSKGDAYIYGKRNLIRKGDYIEAFGTFNEDGFFLSDSVSLKSESPFKNLRLKAEETLRDRLKDLSEDERTLSLMLLLALSDDGDYEINTLAREKGVSHVFALSGMHLSVISLYFSSFLSLFMERRKAEKITIIPLFIFTFLSGFRPSLLRALIFRLLTLFVKDSSADERLFLKFLLHQALSPLSLLRAGSVFSYLSFSAMILLQERFENLLYRIFKVRFSAVISSLCCLSFTIPYSFYLFESYTLEGIIYSPIVNFIVTVFMGCLLIYLIFPFFPKIFFFLYSILLKILSLSSISILQTAKAYYLLLSLVVILSLLQSKWIINMLKSCGILITRKRKT